MRYTRFEYKGKVAIGRSAFRFFILIPLIAVVMGLILSRLFIFTSQIGRKAPKVINTVNYPYIDVSLHRYYMVQVGIYSTGDNAKAAQGEIKLKGFPAFIYKDGEYYRVLSYAATDKNNANTKGLDYMKHGIQSVVKEVDIAPASVPDSLKQERRLILLNNMLNCCGEEVDACCSLYLKYESSQIDSKFLRQSLVDMDGKMGKKMQEFKSAGPDNAFYNKMISSCQSFQKILSGESISEGFTPVLFQNKILSSVYIYKDIIKAYNDNINDGR